MTLMRLCGISLGAVEDFEYRKVRVTGRFRHDQELLLGPRTRGDGQPGYFLITPFERTNGYIRLPLDILTGRVHNVNKGLTQTYTWFSLGPRF